MTLPVVVPDLEIDLFPYRIVVGDALEYITKHDGWQNELESWSLKLGQVGLLFKAYLEEAQNIPDTLRIALEQLVADAQASEEAMRNLLASVNWPELPDSPAGYLFRVNADQTGYEAVPPSTIVGGLMADISALLDGVEAAVEDIRQFWLVDSLPAGSLIRSVADEDGNKSFEAVTFAALQAEMNPVHVIEDPGEDNDFSFYLPNSPVDGMQVTLIFEFCPSDRTVVINAGENGEIYGGHASMALDICGRCARLIYKNSWRLV